MILEVIKPFSYPHPSGQIIDLQIGEQFYGTWESAVQYVQVSDGYYLGHLVYTFGEAHFMFKVVKP